MADPLNRNDIIVNRGNGYETPQTSEGLTEEQTLMLSRASTLHNLLFYAHSICLIDQKDPNICTGSLSSICRNVFVLCSVTRKRQSSEFHNHSPLLTMVTLKLILL